MILFLSVKLQFINGRYSSGVFPVFLRVFPNVIIVINFFLNFIGKENIVFLLEGWGKDGVPRG